MVNLIEDMKHRARLLQQDVRRGDPASLARLRQLPELREVADRTLPQQVQRHHCLTALARALGFTGWPPARAALAGEAVDDLGCLVFRDSGGSLWNIWSADYGEAHGLREAHGGYLLAYRRQFLIAEAPFVTFIGLDPEDPDWDRIGRDWARPRDRGAWTRLTAQAIELKLAG